jgi:radical SAM superfamily enzyme YgiQ (UPF0313 family)
MGLMRLLLLIPPLTQLNTPYPATAYLTGFLRSRGYTVAQADVGIEMMLALFSRAGLARLFAQVRALGPRSPGEAKQMLALESAYVEAIEPVVDFLQGKDPTLASRIRQKRFLPEGPRFAHVRGDDARHLATLFLEDLVDLAQATVAPQLGLSRYAEAVGTAASSFDRVRAALAEPPCLTDELMLEAMWRHVEAMAPDLIGFTIPFPGNVYGAFRMAQAIKQRHARIITVLGGGYVNTELRRLTDPRVFDFMDYVTLDDGERPLLSLLEHLGGKRDERDLRRTFLRTEGRVAFRDGGREPDFSQAQVGTPSYDGLALDRYLAVLDTLNPMHRLWSEGHWNKLTVAHGCYWKQCTFCDLGLDYIARYEPTPSDVLVDRIEALIAETGRRGFHFVDEAAPPAALKRMALLLLERGVPITWWGNIRFETAFTPDLCRLLAASGCVAVTAGLEAAHDRLLAAMQKGITVDQAVQAAAAFHEAGVLVHAYLMYGYPTETVVETVESLERVRQMFAAGIIQSAFWHRFVATAHSPIGLDPHAHGIRITGPPFDGFAENDLSHADAAQGNQVWLGEGLRTALYNYCEGHGLTTPVTRWFTRAVPRPRVPRNWVPRVLAEGRELPEGADDRRFVWIGGEPLTEQLTAGSVRVILPGRSTDTVLKLPTKKARWLTELIQAARPSGKQEGADYPLLRMAREQYPEGTSRGFDCLARSAQWRKVRAGGLLLV